MNGTVMNGTEAPLEVAVTVHDGKVVLHLSQSRDYFVLTAAQASAMAEHLARNAYEAHYGKTAPDRGSELARQIQAKAVDEVRPRLITRAAHIIRSLTDGGKSFEYIAEHAVDAVLKEVT